MKRLLLVILLSQTPVGDAPSVTGVKPMTEEELMSYLGRLQVQVIQQSRYIQTLEERVREFTDTCKPEAKKPE